MPETIQCPVCRARQPMQTVCRRCSADLELLKRALEAIDSIRAQLEQARRTDADPKLVDQFRKRLHWLAPKASV